MGNSKIQLYNVVYNYNKDDACIPNSMVNILVSKCKENVKCDRVMRLNMISHEFGCTT